MAKRSKKTVFVASQLSPRSITLSNRRINPSILLLLIGTIFIHSLSFLSLKYATLQSGYVTAILIVLALLLLAFRALLWQRLLMHSDVSYVYPFTSLVQIIILAYAVFLFGEVITVGNAIGILLMLSGSLIMATE